LSCGDECNLNKARALLHPSVLNDNFLHQIFMITRPILWCLTTFSNACSLIWWPCWYKCNFSSMLVKTIVKDISLCAPYIQIVIINIQWVKNMVNLWLR
jgi:hypothetical protein